MKYPSIVMNSPRVEVDEMTIVLSFVVQLKNDSTDVEFVTAFTINDIVSLTPPDRIIFGGFEFTKPKNESHYELIYSEDDINSLYEYSREVFINVDYVLDCRKTDQYMYPQILSELLQQIVEPGVTLDQLADKLKEQRYLDVSNKMALKVLKFASST